MRKMFVFGATHNETNRRTAEDGFVAALGRHGVQATASYSLYPGEQRADRQTVVDYLKKEGYDGALVIKFEGIRSQTVIAPDAGFGYYYGGMWGNDFYAETDQYVKVETSLWNPRTDKLIWSATSETENPTSSRDAIQSLVTRITTALTDARFIPQMPAVAYAPQHQTY